MWHVNGPDTALLEKPVPQNRRLSSPGRRHGQTDAPCASVGASHSASSRRRRARSKSGVRALSCSQPCGPVINSSHTVAPFHKEKEPGWEHWSFAPLPRQRVWDAAPREGLMGWQTSLDSPRRGQGLDLGPSPHTCLPSPGYCLRSTVFISTGSARPPIGSAGRAGALTPRVHHSSPSSAPEPLKSSWLPGSRLTAGKACSSAPRNTMPFFLSLGQEEDSSDPLCLNTLTGVPWVQIASGIGLHSCDPLFNVSVP